MINKYPNNQTKKLIKAISSLTNEKETANFLRDLLTTAEIEEFSARFEIATLLWTTNMPYLEIAQKVGTSTTTVTRVAQWLYKEPFQGYANVLKKMYGESKR